MATHVISKPTMPLFIQPLPFRLIPIPLKRVLVPVLEHEGMEIRSKKGGVKMRRGFEFWKTIFLSNVGKVLSLKSTSLFDLSTIPLSNTPTSASAICGPCKKVVGSSECGCGNKTEPTSSQDDVHSNVGMGHKDEVVEGPYSLSTLDRFMFILLFMFIIYLI